MKRKYYLRGLGIGILITALVFVFIGPAELSDEEIIKRAEKLGYTKVEEEEAPSIGIKDLLGTGTPAPSPTEAVQEKNTPAPTETPTPTSTVAPTERPEPTSTAIPSEPPVPTETVAPTLAPTNTPVPTPTNTPVPTLQPTKAPESTVVTASIKIERGNSAIMVCEKIESAGILKDGDELLNYFIRNNLADYINVGTYTMSSDMTLEEMARLLTGR